MNTTYQPNFKRAVAVGIGLGILIGLLAITSVRCGDSNPSPVSATSDFPDNGSFSNPSSDTTPTPTPTAQPTPPATDQKAKERFNPIFNSQTGTFDVTFEHIAGTHNSGHVGVACYENPHQTQGERQIYYRSQVGVIQNGESRQVSAKIPECKFWQCDGFEGSAITGAPGEEIDVFYGRRLIFGRSGGPQGNCAPPPPEGACEDKLKVEVELDGSEAWIYLKKNNGKVVSSIHRSLSVNGSSGQICTKDGNQEDSFSDDQDRGCCLPYELPRLCSVDPSNRQCAPQCEYGRAEYEEDKWVCPTCEEVNPSSFANFNFSAPLAETLNCKRVGLCGNSGGNCNVVNNSCIGKFTGTNYGPANVVYDRSNPLEGFVDVSNAGPFSFKVKATSSLTEYEEDDPDYVKDTTNWNQKCGEGPENILVDYNWDNHNSRYWYFTLSGPGINFKSSVIDGH